MAYALGPVKPHVRNAAETVGALFSVQTIYGVASRSYASDHPLGLALDFMTYGDRAKGQAIAEYCVTNAAALGVKYVIWYQRIWSLDRASEGWRGMEDRGSVTANHMDHVHVSFLASGSGVTNVAIPDIPVFPWDWAEKGAEAAANPAVQILIWLGNPKNWLRIAVILCGIILLLVALGKMAFTQNVASSVRKVTK